MPFYIVAGAETLAGAAVQPEPVIPLRETLALHALVRKCPHRGEKADCGCEGLRRCAIGKGRDGAVTLNDCLVCVSEMISSVEG